MLSDEAQDRLAENPEFSRAWVEVVVEPSPDTPTGYVAFDDWGRWISVAPAGQSPAHRHALIDVLIANQGHSVANVGKES